MTTEKLLELLNFYKQELDDEGILPMEYPSYDRDAPSYSGYTHLEHARWMCDKAIEFVRLSEIDRAHRWLAWIQNVLFMQAWYTLGEIRDQSREEEPAPTLNYNPSRIANGKHPGKDIFGGAGK